jgi:hypothetical protein
MPRRDAPDQFISLEIGQLVLLCSIFFEVARRGDKQCTSIEADRRDQIYAGP